MISSEPRAAPPAAPGADEGAPVVEVEHLVKRYGKGDKAVTAVQDVSFAVQPGEVFGINTHYTNPYNVPIYPEVWFNFWGTTTPTTKTAINIFPGDVTFSVPPSVAEPVVRSRSKAFVPAPPSSTVRTPFDCCV